MVAIQQETTVQPGGIIQIHSDQFPAGARVHVTVVAETPAPATLPTMASLLGAAPLPYRDPAEIDASLRAERDSWQK